MVKFYFTKNYQLALAAIEEFISSSMISPKALDSFFDEHDKILEFIGANPSTPAKHPTTGDQSWPFSAGRYRIFFKAIENKNSELKIYLLHIIDNKQANRDVYPNNTLPTYEVD